MTAIGSLLRMVLGFALVRGSLRELLNPVGVAFKSLVEADAFIDMGVANRVDSRSEGAREFVRLLQERYNCDKPGTLTRDLGGNRIARAICLQGLESIVHGAFGIGCDVALSRSSKHAIATFTICGGSPVPAHIWHGPSRARTEIEHRSRSEAGERLVRVQIGFYQSALPPESAGSVPGDKSLKRASRGA